MKIYINIFNLFSSLNRKLQLRKRSLKYLLTPNISIDKKVFLGKNIKIEIIGGGKVIIGKNCTIHDFVQILTYGGEIKIGENTSINPYTIIYGHGNTTIGSNVMIAAQNVIIPENHQYSDKHELLKMSGTVKKGITIEDNVWIGTGCKILDGIIIREGSIIAAGAVINKSTENYSIWGGIPGKKIKSY